MTYEDSFLQLHDHHDPDHPWDRPTAPDHHQGCVHFRGLGISSRIDGLGLAHIPYWIHIPSEKVIMETSSLGPVIPSEVRWIGRDPPIRWAPNSAASS